MNLNTIIEDMDNEDSDLTNSDDDDGEENSHFQFYWFQGVNQTTGLLPNKIFVFNQTFYKRSDGVLFKQNHTK